MDVTITVTTGGGKKANRESKSVTLKEVQVIGQVEEALRTQFKDYFPPITTLADVKGKKQKSA